MRRTNTTLKILSVGIACVQVADILLHAATNQLEPMRVSSNIVLLLWLAIMASGKLKEKSQMMAIVSVTAYLGLNIIFLAIEGVTNPQQGGTLRVTLFVLIFITVMLSGLFTYLFEKSAAVDGRKNE